MAEFQARVFAHKAGFTVVLDGVSHFDVASLSEARRMARALVRARVSAAFPDRPELNREGAQNVLRFSIEVREVPEEEHPLLRPWTRELPSREGGNSPTEGSSAQRSVGTPGPVLRLRAQVSHRPRGSATYSMRESLRSAPHVGHW